MGIEKPKNPDGAGAEGPTPRGEALRREVLEYGAKHLVHHAEEAGMSPEEIQAAREKQTALAEELEKLKRESGQE
jgi:hypothetical protein